MSRNIVLIAMFAVALSATQAWSADKQDQAFIKDAIEGNLAKCRWASWRRKKARAMA
jgi:hypothetical protein